MKKVIAVVVTYNRKELLKECIEALINQDYQNCDILIVDNASTDGTKEYINNYITENKVIYHNTGANLGGAGGFNYGMKEACKLGCDFVWVMDDDCIVHPDSLSKLLEADQKLNGNYGFLSSKVLWKDGSLCKMNIPKKTFGTWLKDFDHTQEVAMASFVSLFMKKETIMQVGLPIKEFFIWTDDWEFTRRISRKQKCYYVVESIVTHKCKSNVGASIAEVDERMERFRYLYRNDVVLYRREGLKGWILFYLRLCKHKLKILKSDKKDKKERFKIIDNAVKEGKQFLPKIEMVDDRIRVLEFICENLNNGGEEMFIMNISRNIDKSRFQVDLFTPYTVKNPSYEKELKELGCGVYESHTKHGRFNKFPALFHNTKKFLKDNPYDVVHIHSGSITSLTLASYLCKKYHISKIIVHSHCAGIESTKHKIIKKIMGWGLSRFPTHFLACSTEAGVWKFPDEIMNSNKFAIVNNGIDYEKFIYNPIERQRIRKELGIDDNELIIGHIGRFTTQKNHEFIVKIAKTLLSQNKNMKFLLLGVGELEAEIKEKVSAENLNDKIVFLGRRDDIYNMYQAFDIFILPSLYEGLPIVGIEAQTSGLYCFFSDIISKEVDITGNCEFLPLEETTWVNKIQEFKPSNNRENMKDKIIKAEYDIHSTIHKLEKIYEEREK